MTEVLSFESDAALTAQAAADIDDILNTAIAERGTARLVLTGGTLGIKILSDLAKQQLDLSKLEIFFGDERFVALDHEDRNEQQGLNAWPELNRAKLHRFPDASSPLDGSAQTFDSEVANLLGPITNEAAAFDVVILGMGPDGHVASLFPGHQHSVSWIVSEHNSPKPPSERLSFSYQALNRSRVVFFLAAGSSKAEVARCAIKNSECELPAAKVKGLELTRWYVDQEISREL
jgi:6-phosphogluconolactonase